MKKTLIVIALAMALVFAFASPAFAKYAGFSASTQYVAWTTAQAMASANADAALMAQGPHKGYATTTIKCAVCHAVHRGTTKLLNSGTSCAYCHAPVAEGGGAIATNLISWYTPPQGPHSSCGSNYCHGGPHGVGASTYTGPASKLLTAAADTELANITAANGLGVASLATYSATTRALATGAVCERSGCHEDSLFGVVTSGATKDLSGAGIGTAAGVTAHRVVASATTTWNADSSMGASITNVQIAYAGATYCSSCHDLEDDNNGGKLAFPHGITGVVDSDSLATGAWRPAVWLTAGAYAGAPTYAVSTYNDYSGGATVATAAGSSILDGICLKCHRGSAGASGVGLTY